VALQTPINFTAVPVVYPSEHGSKKTININISPFQLLKNAKIIEKTMVLR
jgi:hypothetical protein